MNDKKIFITRPISPSKLRLVYYFMDILHSRIYTNDGKYLKKLEADLVHRWKVDHVVVMTNGTLPIVCLLAMLGRDKKILTTPFTFIATTNAIIASGNVPVFADINADTLLPAPDAIEESLNNNDISAVLLTQVFGLVPEYELIQEICARRNIPVFFDSSHSFGVKVGTGSAYGIGDATTASFHSTKNFSTIEGGAIATNNPEIHEYAKSWRNFGFVDGEIVRQGVNAKMHEFSAAFGLAVLPRMRKEMRRRAKLFHKLQAVLAKFPVKIIVSPNASYFPVIFSSEKSMLRVKTNLERMDIFPRRYFYPSIDELAMQLGFDEQPCPVSRSVAKSILCLPLGSNVSSRTIDAIERAFSQNEW